MVQLYSRSALLLTTSEERGTVNSVNIRLPMPKHLNSDSLFSNRSNTVHEMQKKNPGTLRYNMIKLLISGQSQVLALTYILMGSDLQGTVEFLVGTA